MIGLSKIDSLNLLGSIYKKVWITRAVIEEIGVGPHGRHLVETVQSLPWARIIETPPITKDLLAKDLGPGESSVIAWAMENPGVDLIIDDRAAARCAKLYGLSTIGVIGILLLAKRGGKLSELKPRLDALTEVGFYLSEGLRAKALALAGEDDFPK